MTGQIDQEERPVAGAASPNSVLAPTILHRTAALPFAPTAGDTHRIGAFDPGFMQARVAVEPMVGMARYPEVRW